jgi:hypothetical protein
VQVNAIQGASFILMWQAPDDRSAAGFSEQRPGVLYRTLFKLVLY